MHVLERSRVSRGAVVLRSTRTSLAMPSSYRQLLLTERLAHLACHVRVRG